MSLMWLHRRWQMEQKRLETSKELVEALDKAAAAPDRHWRRRLMITFGPTGSYSREVRLSGAHPF